jgi:hypothetical protein
MAGLSRPSLASREAVKAIEAKRRGDTYKPVDMSFMRDLFATLDADREGRPYSIRPRTSFDDARDEQRLKDGGGPCNLDDPTDPGAIMLWNMLDLKKRMEESGEADELRAALAQAKKDTLAEIQREQRERERRERQRAKRARRAERKRQEAVQDAAPAGSPM